MQSTNANESLTQCLLCDDFANQLVVLKRNELIVGYIKINRNELFRENIRLEVAKMSQLDFL